MPNDAGVVGEDKDLDNNEDALFLPPLSEEEEEEEGHGGG
jgi:hypothetical protein